MMALKVLCPSPKELSQLSMKMAPVKCSTRQEKFAQKSYSGKILTVVSNLSTSLFCIYVVGF